MGINGGIGKLPEYRELWVVQKMGDSNIEIFEGKNVGVVISMRG